MEILIVSGQSGAGKSSVARVLEDCGFYCVDNMPVELLPPFAEMCMASKGRYERVALVTDVRAGQSFDALFTSLSLLRAMNCEYRIMFIESRTDIIVRRYKETRRIHPLAKDGEGLESAIEKEYELLSPIRAGADIIINTSSLNSTTLRTHVMELFTQIPSKNNILVDIRSFGFKYGLPTEADIVFDVRFLPNPYHIPELRPFSGIDEPVRHFVLNWPQTGEFNRRILSLMDFLIPQYAEEGKLSVVTAIGCTGGRHRSVVIASILHEHMIEREFRSILTHRDIQRDKGEQ